MNNLKSYFPKIRERKEVLKDIQKSETLVQEFNRWKEKEREQFLDFCTGVRGVKILSDTFFKEVLNPEYAPERLNDFLSLIMKQKVKILKVLPNDSVRIASEGTLLITDLVVELEDGSIVNVEVQRIGYKFPGERAACYSADLLLRQYKRVRDAKGETFTYKDIKPVYTIVLFEKSPSEFKKCPNEYIHYAEAKTNTKLEMNLLQKFVFIPLDIFSKRSHNEIIKDKLEAWLTFFSTDEPQKIEELITTYPKFKVMYEDIYDICLNTEKVMGMFSKELQMLDENTVQYMIDEMQEEIDGMRGTIDEQQERITEQQGVITGMKSELEEKEEQIRRLEELVEKLEKGRL